MSQEDRTPRKIVPEEKRDEGYRQALAAAIIGLLLLVAGIVWLGVTATNTSTTSGYYMDEQLYYRVAPGIDGELTVPAPGELDSAGGERIQVYYGGGSVEVHWYRAFLGPLVVLGLATVCMLAAAAFAERELRPDRDGDSKPRSRS